jgi:sec-independent protein translocase protein TatA
MGSFSLAHWLIVLVVVLLVFGPNKLGRLGQGLGEGIRNFKKGLAGDDADAAPRQLDARSKRTDEPQS